MDAKFLVIGILVLGLAGLAISQVLIEEPIVMRWSKRSAVDGILCPLERVCYARIPNDDGSRKDVLINDRLAGVTDYHDPIGNYVMTENDVIEYDGELEFQKVEIDERACETPYGHINPGNYYCGDDNVLYYCKTNFFSKKTELVTKTCNEFCSVTERKCVEFYETELTINGQAEPNSITVSPGEEVVIEFVLREPHPKTHTITANMDNDHVVFDTKNIRMDTGFSTFKLKAPSAEGDYKIVLLVDTEPQYKHSVPVNVVNPLELSFDTAQTQSTDEPVIVKVDIEYDGRPYDVYAIDYISYFEGERTSPIRYYHPERGEYYAEYLLSAEGNLSVRVRAMADRDSEWTYVPGKQEPYLISIETPEVES